MITPMQERRNGNRRKPMPRPRGEVPITDMFEPLRTVENLIASVYWTMGKYNQRKIGDKLMAARELIRQANDEYVPPSKGADK